MSASEVTIAQPVPAGEEAPGLPRLLAGIPAEGAMALGDHLALHGMPPAPGRGRRGERELAEALLEETDRAGLLGRGGAGFPTARKMRAVAAARGRAIVVVNAAEGEPASLKDRTLLEALPHLVLDGAVMAALAVGADEAIVCVCESANAALESVHEALRERSGAAGYEPYGGIGLRVSVLGTHYVAGQETSLVSHLNGGVAKPLFTPPMPFERGVGRRPTLINNTETLAHLALIGRHGAGWFRQLGTAGQPGSALVTLCGPVANEGVYEIEQGASLASLIEAGGGRTAGVRAALLGGYSGAWVDGERLRGVALSNEHLAAHGASLGAGVVQLISEEACPVAETARLGRWLAGQSARQCGPCVHGLQAIADTLEEVVRGGARSRALERLSRLASLVHGRGACSHPDGTVNMLLSALEVFPGEFAEHARRGPCAQCARGPELPLPARPVPVQAPRRGLYRR